MQGSYQLPFPVPGANPTFSIENWRMLYLLISYLTFATDVVIQKIEIKRSSLRISRLCAVSIINQTKVSALHRKTVAISDTH